MGIPFSKKRTKVNTVSREVLSRRKEVIQAQGSAAIEEGRSRLTRGLEGIEEHLFANFLFTNEFKYFMYICLIALFVFIIFFDNINLSGKLATYYTIGSILWYLVFKANKGFNVFLNRDGTSALNLDKNKQTLWFFDFITFFAPFAIFWYKFTLSVKRYSSKENTPEELKEIVLEQIERYDAIIEHIPVVLFGVGVIFEQQEFFHNKYLLNGVLFGTVLPLMVKSLIVDSTNVDNLIIIESIMFILTTIGSMLILVAIFKYNNHRADQKQKEIEEQNNPEIVKESFNSTQITDKEYTKLGKHLLTSLKREVAQDMLDSLKKCREVANPFPRESFTTQRLQIQDIDDIQF